VLIARQNAAPPLSVALRGMDERLAANAPDPVPDPAPVPVPDPAPAPETRGALIERLLPLASAENARLTAENARLRAEVERLQGVVVGQQQRIANIRAYLTE